MKIVFATNNLDKLKEMREILAGLELEVKSPQELGIEAEVEEDKETFEENAAKKAKEVAEKSGLTALSDDSGLCIEALGGKPGIYTARWAGEGASPEEMVEYTLKQMEGVEDRRAYFETAAALCNPQGECKNFKGVTKGEITKESRGEMKSPKLPYDIIFSPEGDKRTFAEMSAREKNQMSHRGRAFEKLREYLKEI